MVDTGEKLKLVVLLVIPDNLPNATRGDIEDILAEMLGDEEEITNLNPQMAGGHAVDAIVPGSGLPEKIAKRPIIAQPRSRLCARLGDNGSRIYAGGTYSGLYYLQ